MFKPATLHSSLVALALIAAPLAAQAVQNERPMLRASSTSARVSRPEDAPGEDFESKALAAEVQRALIKRGFQVGTVDGQMGAQTRAAISAFQSAKGMRVTGNIGVSLLDALGVE